MGRVKKWVEVSMASHSGIRAGSESGEYSRRPILRNADGYGAWRVKMETILDAEDCWEIVQGTELIPIDLTPAPVAVVFGAVAGVVVAQTAAEILLIATRSKEIKEFTRRFKKATSLITQAVDDAMVQTLSVHNKDPKLIWDALASDYNTVTPAQLSLARQDFRNFRVSDGESYLEIKQRFDELVRKVMQQGGGVSVDDQLQTLLGSLPEKYDILRESYFSVEPAPNIGYLWRRMFDIETTQKRRESEAEGSGMRGEAFYQNRGRGSGAFRGRGSPGNRGGGSSRGKATEEKNESCFRCGEVDHWSRECPKKDSTCTWCGVVGHLEKTCYSKANGAARGGRTGGSGENERGQRVGHGRYGEVGHAEVLIGEVDMGKGGDDGENREWVCDSGADYHMTGDVSVFEKLEEIPFDFLLNHITGEVQVTHWGVVRLSTDKADGQKGELELHEVLFMPGLRVNIFSLRRIRTRGACSYTFGGRPQPGKVIPILNEKGEQIATMRETLRARQTLICEEHPLKGQMGVIGDREKWYGTTSAIQLGGKKHVQGTTVIEIEPECEVGEELDLFNPWPALYDPTATTYQGYLTSIMHQSMVKVPEQEGGEIKAQVVAFLSVEEIRSTDNDVFWDSPVEDEEVEIEEEENEEEEEAEGDVPFEIGHEEESEKEGEIEGNVDASEDESMDGYESENEWDNKSTVTYDVD